eukprot:gene950-1202_t
MTVPTYTGLNELVDKFGSEGFVVLGFPSNQFNQEPGKNNEILNCLEYVRPGSGFQPTFPLFNKIIVNGAGTDPVFIWLKSGCGPTSNYIGTLQYMNWTPVQTTDITWNFEKFLISRSGILTRRYSPVTFPQLLFDDIADLLSQDS